MRYGYYMKLKGNIEDALKVLAKQTYKEEHDCKQVYNDWIKHPEYIVLHDGIHQPEIHKDRASVNEEINFHANYVWRELSLTSITLGEI